MTRHRQPTTTATDFAPADGRDLNLPDDNPPPVAWARPWAAISLPARKTLRAGAWYPVLETRDDASVVLVLDALNQWLCGNDRRDGPRDV